LKYLDGMVTSYKEKVFEFNKIIFNAMSDLLYIIAVILIIVWALGYFAFDVGSLIHILLVIAIIAILLRLIRGSRTL